ncbi:MAG: MarP family serine protease [Acidimicrobiales bacterium]
MNFFDLLILAVAGLAALGGYRVGLLARVAGWVGWVFGLVVAAGFAPTLLSRLDLPAPQIRLLLAGGAFLTVAALGAAVGEFAGARLRMLLPPGGLRQADRVAGGVAGAFGVMVVVWLLLPALAYIPGDLSSLARGSTVATTIDRVAPDTPGALRAMRDLVTDSDFPEVFAQLRPAPATGNPPAASAISPPTVSRVIESTVKVTGESCGRILDGSGFVAAPGRVVTNAHVVAGVERPQVLLPDGRRLPGRVSVFDFRKDLAILEVANLNVEPLPMGEARISGEGAVFGHPGGQEAVEVSPARIDTRINASGRDLYGNGPVLREVLVLAAELAPGDSGGALVDTTGAVVGVAFAIAPDDPGVAYALSDSELASVMRVPPGQADTGPCLR